MRFAIIVLFLSLLASAAPPARADVDLCSSGACVYEWAWNWGSGSCRSGDGQDVWATYATARGSLTAQNETHEADVEMWCDAYHVDNASGGSSWVHAQLVTTNETSGEQSWIFIDWYGSDDSSGASTCTIRIWSYNEHDLPTGVVQEPCPGAARPPFVIDLLPVIL